MGVPLSTPIKSSERQAHHLSRQPSQSAQLPKCFSQTAMVIGVSLPYLLPLSPRRETPSSVLNLLSPVSPVFDQ